MGPDVSVLSVEELAVEVARLKMLAQTQSGMYGSVLHNSASGATVSREVCQYGDLESRSKQVFPYESGDHYKGDTLGTMRHGRGTFTSATGDTYTGGWQYNKRQGKGHAKFIRRTSAETSEQPLPVSYEGDWEDDRTQGHGTCIFQDGAVYTGDWHQDQRSGWGRHVFRNQDWYEGEWAADAMHGQGVLKASDGSHFKAEWHHGQPRKGHWCSADGKTEYEGQVKGMAWHGFGTLHQTGIKKYMGHWREGLEHGHGQCITADGVKYDGLWVQGARQGQGKGSRSDGYLYSGSWLNDLPHGQGKCRFADGSKYEGDWQAGKRHGQGMCIHSNSDQYKGQWQADAQHGRGLCWYKSGDKYQGEWRAGKRHGHGTCHFADGTKFSGDWEQDAWLQSAAEPSLCTATGPGLSCAVAGQEAAFVIQAHDELKNKRLSGGDGFMVTLIGPAGRKTTATVNDKGDGTYSATYSCCSAGLHELYITTGEGESVAEAPYRVQVVSCSPVPRKSTVSGPGRKHAVVGEPTEFAIQGRDQYGNRCEGKLDQALPVSIELSCKPFICEVEVTSHDNASYVCHYTASQPGFYRLVVTSRDVHLYGSPFSVQITEALQQHNTDRAPAEGQHHPTTKNPSSLQHQANGMQAVCRPLIDSVKQWEEVAAAEYAADGDMQGWQQDNATPESSEDKYLKTNPTVPVVENLEDIWLVSKLQNERKAAQSKQEHVAQQRKYKQMSGQQAAKQ